jgi:catechol 2,3-dioxygenase-like lactoylglutathione lyase family enzyme
MADFYCRVLGFRVSDWIEDFFVFLRCNPDHHTVNFIRGAKTKMHHIAFEMKDFAHIQDACELLALRKIPINWGPVRHGPGHNVAIYHRNADEQNVEFYIELDQLKDEELGYFDPRPWHHDTPQRPKVWDRKVAPALWGPLPLPDFRRDHD